MTVRKFIETFEDRADTAPTGAPKTPAEQWALLNAEFDKNKILATQNKWAPTPAEFNRDDLSIALMYPGVASYLKKYRARTLGSAYAVTGPLAPGFLPYGRSSGLTISLMKGGQLTGGQLNNLNSQFPIEMKGFGALVAASMRGGESMRGGSFPSLAIGTVNSPTIWRPLTDDSFISESLLDAVQKLQNKLSSKGMKLDSSVETKIQQRLTALRVAETKAKTYRDKLTIAANRLNGHDSSLTQPDYKKGTMKDDKIDATDVDELALEYNRAMKEVQKNEGVLLKVIDSMGRTHEIR
jgi:hypothetical protein